MEELAEEMMYNSKRVLALETLVMCMEDTIKILQCHGCAQSTVDLLKELLKGLDET